jgi:hypothetical protein
MWQATQKDAIPPVPAVRAAPGTQRFPAHCKLRLADWSLAAQPLPDTRFLSRPCLRESPRKSRSETARKSLRKSRRKSASESRYESTRESN